MAKVFIAYDFEIKHGLTSHFEFVDRKQPNEIEWPGNLDDKPQGEIWRNFVRPKLDSSPRFVAFVDLPNANVGYEIGYALGHGEGKEAALAHTRKDLPSWLKLPPLNGLFCQQINKGLELLNLINSKDWFKSPPPPESGERILLLCPLDGIGANLHDLVNEEFKEWRHLDRDGWSFNDLPGKLKDVGLIVWLILPHNEGDSARDGSENAATAVVAGYAEAAGIEVKVLRHVHARTVADVAPKAIEFANDAQLQEQLKRLEKEFCERRKESAQTDKINLTEQAFARPDVGVAPEFEASLYAERFIGREGLLADLADAVHGLGERCQGRPAQGRAKVQAFWYHGFGGMGKSWFLRRALLHTMTDLPSAKIALVDWDHATWRQPLVQPPETIKDLLDPIAYRLAQLYSIEALDRYWQALQRTGQVRSELSRHQERFNQHVRELREGKTADQALQLALTDRKLWANSDKLTKNLDELQRNNALRKEVFDRWFEQGGGSSDDPEALLRPDSLRINALRETIRNIAIESNPLVLALDTCELLSPDLERALRQLLAPLCDGKLPFLLLFGSRLQPDAAEPAGSKELWRALVTEERWRSVPFDEGVRFTVQQIQQSLQQITPPVDQPEKLAEQLHHITRGVPLALRSLLDLHERDSNVLSELDSLTTDDHGDDLGGASGVDEVIQIVAGRFLLHLANRSERLDDFKAIIALSLLTKGHRELLSRLWNTTNVRGRLRDLAIRYALLAEFDLHETVRSFLRRRWRMEDRPAEVGAVIEELNAIAKDLELPGQPGDSVYMENLAVKLNLMAWRDEEHSLSSFAPALALALANNEHTQLLVSLAAEIRNATSRLRGPIKALKALNETLGTNPSWTKSWGSDEVLEWLEQEEARATWSPVETASLDLLRGLKRSSQEEQKGALRPLLAALREFPKGAIPRAAEFGEALFQIGYHLAEKNESATDAAEAFRAAIKLQYAEGSCHNNLGVLLQRHENYIEAEAQYRKAMEIDVQEPVYPRNLAGLYIELRRYEEAEQWCRKALEINPSYAASINDLGRIYQATQRPEEAEAQYRKAMDFDPREPDYPRHLGNLYIDLKRYEEAEQWHRKALEINPSYAASINDLGRIYQYQATQRPEEAEAQYRKAMDFDPREPLYPRNLGNLYIDLRRYEEAEQWCRKALEINPSYAASINDLGRIYQATQRPEEAEAQYRKAMDFDPREPLYPRNLGNLYIELRRYEEAEQWCRKALEINPSYATSINDLGRIYQATQRPEEAEAQYRKAMDFGPREPAYPRNLGNLYIDLRRYEEAEQWHRKALEINPSYAASINDLGRIYQATQRPEEAEAQYRKAMDFGPREPAYPRNLGNLYIDLRRYEEAEQWHRKALEINPSYAASINDLGRIYQATQRPEEAEAQYRKAMDFDPREPAYPRNLGNLYIDLKRYEEAEQWHRKALEINPSYAASINDLGRIYQYQATQRPEEAEAQYRKAMDFDPREPAYPRNLGNLYIELRRYEEAEQWCRKALEINPSYAASINDLGRIYQATQRPEEAEAQYHKAMDFGPREPAYPRNLGNLYIDLKRYEEAEQWHRKALEINPSYAASINDLGRIYQYQATQRPEEAEAQYRKAMDFDPREPAYPNNLGNLYIDLRRYEEAEQWHRKALEINPSYAASINDLGRIYQATQRPEEAEAQYRKAMDFDPREPLYPRNLGNLYIELKRYEEAEQWCRKALEINPSYAASINDLGRIYQYQATQRPEEAEAQYRKAMDFDPREPAYPRNLGNLYIDLRRYEEAEQWHRKALEINPSYAASINDLGRIYEATQRPEEAEAQYRKAMDFDPREPLYPRNLGNLYIELKRYEEAEQWCRKALEINPSYAASINDLGRIYQATQRPEEAEAQYRKAMDFGPREPLYPRNLGNLYIDLRRYEEAEQWCRKALEINPSYATSINDLGRIYQATQRPEEAEGQYRKAMDFDVEEPAYPGNLANLYAELKRHEEAESYYRKMLELVPNNAYTLHSLAWNLYQRSTSLEEAEQLAKRAVEIVLNPYFLHTLTDIQLKISKWEMACETLQAWIGACDEPCLNETHQYVIKTFKRVVSQGNGAALLNLLRQPGVGQHWTPWLAALTSLDENNQAVALSDKAIDIQRQLKEVGGDE